MPNILRPPRWPPSSNQQIMITRRLSPSCQLQKLLVLLIVSQIASVSIYHLSNSICYSNATPIKLLTGSLQGRDQESLNEGSGDGPPKAAISKQPNPRLDDTDDVEGDDEDDEDYDERDTQDVGSGKASMGSTPAKVRNPTSSGGNKTGPMTSTSNHDIEANVYRPFRLPASVLSHQQMNKSTTVPLSFTTSQPETINRSTSAPGGSSHDNYVTKPLDGFISNSITSPNSSQSPSQQTHRYENITDIFNSKATSNLSPNQNAAIQPQPDTNSVSRPNFNFNTSKNIDYDYDDGGEDEDADDDTSKMFEDNDSDTPNKTTTNVGASLTPASPRPNAVASMTTESKYSTTPTAQIPRHQSSVTTRQPNTQTVVTKPLTPPNLSKDKVQHTTSEPMPSSTRPTIPRVVPPKDGLHQVDDKESNVDDSDDNEQDDDDLEDEDDEQDLDNSHDSGKLFDTKSVAPPNMTTQPINPPTPGSKPTLIEVKDNFNMMMTQSTAPVTDQPISFSISSTLPPTLVIPKTSTTEQPRLLNTLMPTVLATPSIPLHVWPALQPVGADLDKNSPTMTYPFNVVPIQYPSSPSNPMTPAVTKIASINPYDHKFRVDYQPDLGEDPELTRQIYDKALGLYHATNQTIYSVIDFLSSAKFELNPNTFEPLITQPLFLMCKYSHNSIAFHTLKLENSTLTFTL